MIFELITNKKPKLWGSIIGYGNLKYVYKTGQSENMPLIGLANRKNAITLYISYSGEDLHSNYNLGKYTTGKSCLYIKKLEDIDLHVLEKVMKTSIDNILKLDFITVIE